MKTIFFILALCLVKHLSVAQKPVLTTTEFSVEGRIKQPAMFSIADLSSLQARPFSDVLITNHVGEKKHPIVKLKGVLLKDILSKVETDAENPKVLSEYYYVFIATDNYKIVFSWNEIFNTETGKNIYVIMEQDGKKIDEMTDRISLIVPTDFKTGRRNIKNLSKIIVQRAN